MFIMLFGVMPCGMIPISVMPQPQTHNSFEFGRELSREELIDRTDELARVERALSGGGKLFLIGPRRFGKTSLLAAAASELRARNVRVLRFNIEAFSTKDADFGGFVNQNSMLVKTSHSKPLNAMRAAATTTSSLRLAPDCECVV